MEAPAPQVRVVIPQMLRQFCSHRPAPGGPELCLPARDVRELLAELGRQHPQVHVRLCDERGEPRPHINVFVNDHHVRAQAGLDTALRPGDLVMILPAVSGG